MEAIMPDINELKNILSKPQDVVILSHRNPDGDALGSSIGLSRILQKMHHSVTVVLPSEYPLVFSWMPEVKDIIVFDVDSAASIAAVKKASVIVCVDFNGLDRIDKLGEEVNQVKDSKKVVLIDHHLDPEPFADVVYSDPSASSTCQLIYKLAQMCDWTGHIDAETAACLYAGILTDTGSFHHGTTESAFEVSAKLIGHGVDGEEVHDLIFRNQTEKQLRLLGHCLANRMEIIPAIRTGIIWLNKQDYEKFAIDRGDTEGIVNHLMTMKNVDVAAFITEQPSIVKLSLRSKGDISVQELARDHFNGGGHKNAAGGSMYASLSAVLEKFKRVVPFYIPTIKSFRL